MPHQRDHSRSRSRSPRKRDDGSGRDRGDRRGNARTSNGASKRRSSYDDDDREHERDRRFKREDRKESHDKDRRSRKYEDSTSSRRDKVHKSDDRSKERKRRYDSESEDDFLDLERMGVKEISVDDYFVKSAEFKHWLKADRGKYIDEMSSSDAHRYFRKFVRRWNDGALDRAYYRAPKRSSSNTAYKWSFSGSQRPPSPSASPSRSPERPLEADGVSSEDEIGPSLPRNVSGPSRPSASDRQLAREETQDAQRAQRKTDRRAAYERADEMAPRGVSKEGKMAEKRASNAVNKEMREKDVGGLEMDEGTLMGDESSFQTALRARDGAQGWKAEKRQEEIANRRAAMDDRMAERKQKETATMDMLKAMAKQRFG